MGKTGRNDLCPCGSGKKYKKCHEAKDNCGPVRNWLMLAIVGGAMLAAIAAGISSFTGEPAGATRVWSVEHGHYHDANGVAIP